MMHKMIFSDIVLASKSPRRAELLKKHGVDFSVFVPQCEELTSCDDLKCLPELNAVRKAAAAADIFPQKTVIGADTVILFENTVIGKPENLEHAVQILLKLAGKKHQVVSGCAVICRNKNICHSFSCVSEVVFKNLSEAQIRKYISEVNVLDKAGAYAIQEHGDDIIKSFSGSLENIIGLPVCELCEFLKNI